MDHSSLMLGELREFKRATLARLDTIERKTDTFQMFRAKIIGLSSMVSLVASMLATLVVEWYRSK